MLYFTPEKSSFFIESLPLPFPFLELSSMFSRTYSNLFRIFGCWRKFIFKNILYFTPMKIRLLKTSCSWPLQKFVFCFLRSTFNWQMFSIFSSFGDEPSCNFYPWENFIQKLWTPVWIFSLFGFRWREKKGRSPLSRRSESVVPFLFEEALYFHFSVCQSTSKIDLKRNRRVLLQV